MLAERAVGLEFLVVVQLLKGAGGREGRRWRSSGLRGAYGTGAGARPASVLSLAASVLAAAM